MATRSWNKVELIGNLTRDVELRFTPSGTAVASFSIATNRTYVSDGEKKEEVDFHRIVAWNKLGELCNQLLKKGNRVFVSGRLQNRSWETQDGQTKNLTEIVIEDMILLTSRDSTGSYEATAKAVAAEDVSSKEEATKEDASTEASIETPEAEEEKKEENKQSLRSDDLKQSLRSDDLKQSLRPNDLKAQEDPGNLDDLPF